MFRPLLLLWLLLASFSLAAQQPVELVIRRFRPAVDGDLADWPKDIATIALGRKSVVGDDGAWSGTKDASADILVSCNNNHLFVAGTVRDDQFAVDEIAGPERTDCIELHIGPAGGRDTGARSVLRLMPLQPHRPWSWAQSSDAPGADTRQTATQLGGLKVAARPLERAGYQFEAAIPFHHLPALVPGSDEIGFELLLRDFDPVDGNRSTTLSWTAVAPDSDQLDIGLESGLLKLTGGGLLVPLGQRAPLLSGELLTDLPYLVVPLLTLVALVFLLRAWGRVRSRVRWLRPVLVIGGLTAFAIGLSAPNLYSSWRARDHRKQLAGRLEHLQDMLGRLEAGSLASYRGASRDLALIDLLTGRSIKRQRYTSYRPLVEIAPFGAPIGKFDELPVRSYWLPLQPERAESFQFDPPLHGKRLHLVLARPVLSSFTLRPAGSRDTLAVELDFGTDKQERAIDLDLPFAGAESLGRDFWEACVVPIDLEQDLRAMTLGCDGSSDLRLVGVSLERDELGDVVPVSLGGPTRDGVLTDLRGPYPQDAGIELAANSVSKVAIPEQDETPQRLWFFYRAVYPGLATANPGARVAEVVLHFADGRAKQTLVLEHQVSMFYELAVHNTRDDTPEGSQASIALTWVDESQERHINLGFPVRDLPQDTALAAIEFRNLADYRIRFRSVVLVNERAAAPQDPPDSPLIREGQERLLDPEALAELQGVAVSIYRGGQLSASTLPESDRVDVQTMPRIVGASEATTTQARLVDDGRRLSLFEPLRGDGWDGAVLAVASTDGEWIAAGQTASRIGLLLCLISTPFLLVLLSEMLAAVTNLRFRLWTVMTVASLLPLGLLSLVLVQALEGGHTTDLEDSVRATVNSATVQLEEQKRTVKVSAQQWLQDLTTLAAQKLKGVEPEQLAASTVAIADELQQLLAGQLPPDWRGGFMRLKWQPQMDETRADPVALVAGDDTQLNVETPARLDPGLFMQWGQLMLGVRAEQVVRGGTFVLTVARPLDDSLVGSLAPGHDLLLTDVRGYPLAASEGRLAVGTLLHQAFDPRAMAAREQAVSRADEARQTAVVYEDDRVIGTDVLRDLQDTPRGLLVVAMPDERATLDLAIGRIPVRAFFLLVAGSLVVLAGFLSYVVSGRISRPIERLEHGAQSLSRGFLETRVPDDEGGQVGRLTRAFNQMAADLQGRLQDLQALNRTMSELAAEHDEAVAVEVLRRFCATHTSADAVVATLLDDSSSRLIVYAGGDSQPQLVELGELRLAALFGPFSCRAAANQLPAPWQLVLAPCRSLLGLPIVFGGQTRGVVLLGSHAPEPPAADLELLSTVVAQAASACERSQLQRLAVQDPVTGTFARDYFRRRVADEVAIAWHAGTACALLAVAVAERHRSPAGLLQFAGVLRARLAQDAIIGHAGSGQFEVVLPGVDRRSAERVRQEIVTAWLAQTRASTDAGAEALRSALAVFPTDGPSAEFLFEAVRTQLAVGLARDAVDAESDANLRRAGVTAISSVMRPVYSTLRRVAPTDLPILLEGETGVGKEVLTNLVHRWSRRSAGPLIKVHCASLSETLLASELFGHERGAFTGADRRKIGRFEQADGGTLLLDEVGEIPLDVQVKLLRALQAGEIDRVGGSEPVPIDVRVIAATNRDMLGMVADGRFREDLYYRLQGMVVRVPALRERREELAGLVEYFRRELISTGHASDRQFATAALDELYRQDWPGNIRQLRTTVFRALVLARGDVVEAVDVAAALAGSVAAAGDLPLEVESYDPGLADATAALLPPAGSAAAGPAGLDSAELDSVGLDPAGLDPAGLGSAGLDPAGLGSAGLGSAAVDPSPAVDAAGPTIPRPPATSPQAAGAINEGVLPERLRELLGEIRQRGRYRTQDHMEAKQLSHRTALRDLQALVQLGAIERVGSRRGAYYRSFTPRSGSSD